MPSLTMSARAVYRSLYRELAKQHVIARTEQEVVNAKKAAAMRQYQKMKQATGKATSDLALKPIKFTVLDYDSLELRNAVKNSNDIGYGQEVALFLKHQRVYEELVKKYNDSLIDPDDRLRLSANRVGLDLPQQA